MTKHPIRFPRFVIIGGCLGLGVLLACWILYRRLPSTPDIPAKAPVVIEPGVVSFTTTPPGGEPTGYAQLEFPVASNKTYVVQLTTDFVEYRTVGTFTATNGQTKMCWTVNPATGPFPRLVEQQP